MARVREGDEAAFGELMVRWELPVKRLIGRLVSNTADTEDLAQETFVRVWRNRLRYHPEAEFRPWLFTIAVNLARSRLQWWRRRPSISLDQWREADAPARDTAAPNQREALDALERAAAVRAAVAELPHDLREAIILFCFENLSHAEIAETVGATVKAIETRIARGRTKLRAALTVRL